MKHILYAAIRIAAQRTENQVHFNPDNTPGIFYGEPNEPTPSARMYAVEQLFAGTPLHHQMCNDILHELWDKFALNISCNLVQAILNVGLGAYQDSKHAAYLSRQLRQEVAAIAAAKGVTISPETNYVGQKCTRYSTLQDLDAKRHTEIDIFSGAVIDMGRALHIPTPYNDFVYHAIKALEEKNEGKFEYL